MTENSIEINSIAQKQIEDIAKKCELIKPLVVINCITYNHEAYLRDALEGFVMQKTDFPFVAIVHDDASTDGTAAIIREYAARYPDIILPIYETENQYSKGNGSVSRIMREARNATGAKYVAMCEGDDYWTSPLKLQKQVSFLESHSEYSMVFHKVRVHKTGTDTSADFILADVEEREYSGTEVFESMLFQLASVVVRADVFKDAEYMKASGSGRFMGGDVLLFLGAANVGKIWCIADEMSVYRLHPGGITNVMREDPFRFIKENELILEYFGDKYIRSVKAKNVKGYLNTLQIGIKRVDIALVFKSLQGLIKHLRYLSPKVILIGLKRRLRSR